MQNFLILTVALFMTTFAAACGNTNDANRNAANTNAATGSTSTAANTATTNSTTTANTTATNNSTPATAGGGDVPAAVRSAITDAQTFTTQHKDIPASAITSIEKETGTKIADKDHHSYLAFSTAAGGARRQVGAATVVNAGGQEMVIVYNSKDGSPVIREVRGTGVPAAFLDQFKGKGHDNALKFGQDIKAQGAPENLAQTATNAIKADVLAMQALYGSAHSH